MIPTLLIYQVIFIFMDGTQLLKNKANVKYIILVWDQLLNG